MTRGSIEIFLVVEVAVDVNICYVCFCGLYAWIIWVIYLFFLWCWFKFSIMYMLGKCRNG